VIEAIVTDVATITLDVVRLTLTAPALALLEVTAPTQWLKLFIPPAEGGTERVGRAYTVHHHKPEDQQLQLDIVLHKNGPVALWAATAQVGDLVGLGELKGRFDYPADAQWWLLIADESAQPAAWTILDGRPEGSAVTALFEVSSGDCEPPTKPLSSATDLRWVHRGDAPKGAALVSAVRDHELPAGIGYAWVAGEASIVRDIHLLLAASGLHRRQLRTKGYWRIGHSDVGS
jgi:NADPH-dependent ferric siderophore reductase